MRVTHGGRGRMGDGEGGAAAGGGERGFGSLLSRWRPLAYHRTRSRSHHHTRDLRRPGIASDEKKEPHV